jgi:hypothetical protein
MFSSATNSRATGWGMRKLAIPIMVVLPLVPLALLAWIVIHHLLLKSGFARIEHGTSRSEVVRALGEPNSVNECGKWGGNPPSGCVKEFTYLSILAFPDVWVVSFDAHDRAVRKLRYRSP